jgi:hypothetical protein
MKKLLSGVKSLLSDERGGISSKRLVGIICALFLCITLYQNSFSEEHIAPSAPLVESVAALAAACLGLTSLDKIFGKVQGGVESDNEAPKES